MAHRTLALAGLLALALAAPARADFIGVVDQATFLHFLDPKPNPFTDTYNDLVPGNFVGSPLGRSGNGFSYVANATQGFFAVGTTADPLLSTEFALDPIVYNTFSSPVLADGHLLAVGGIFFATDINGEFLPGVRVTVTAVDVFGKVVEFFNPNPTDNFFGVLPTTPIASFTVRVTQPSTTAAFVTANDFMVGVWTIPPVIVPAPPTLLLELVGAACVARLRRQARPSNPG
jgi:hypothetical protein